MPLDLIIVGGDHWVAWNAVCVSQLMHWGVGQTAVIGAVQSS